MAGRKPPIAIARILNPRSVAIIGASKDPGKYGSRVVELLKRFGFKGRVVPVNPKEQEILGYEVARSIKDVRGAIDVALLALPPEKTLGLCRECAEAGVGCCIIVTTGFAELDVEGRRRQDELTRIAGETGMRILGPNCMGLLNPSKSLALCSSVVFDDAGLLPGSIGLISQSGGLMVSLYDRARTAGIGFACCVSLGNQSDLEACDFLDAMIEDDRTQAICMYMEELKDLARFSRLAEQALHRKKPIFLYKAGRTDAGVAAAMAHTASTAGSYDMVKAVCAERGVVLMDDPDDMIRAADIIVRWGLPRGDGIGLISTSGGSLTITADRLAERGLRLAEFSPETKTKLLHYLEPAYTRDPVDFGGANGSSGEKSAMAGAVAKIVTADENVAALFVALNTSRPYTEICRSIGDALAAQKKPFILLFTPGSVGDAARTYYRRKSYPYFDSLDSAIRVLAALVEYAGFLRRHPAAAPAIEIPVRPED